MAKRTMSFEVSDELRDAIRKMAFDRDVSVSELIRSILIEKINGGGTENENGD